MKVFSARAAAVRYSSPRCTSATCRLGLVHLPYVLEGMAGVEVAVYVTLGDAVHARERHEVRVGADDVERIQLDMAQVAQQRAHALGALGVRGSGEPEVADEPRPCLIGGQRDRGR
jgi:hypothetical protein